MGADELFPFQPDWVSPPGDTIKDLLDERQIGTPAFASAMSLTEAEVAKLLLGEAPITPEIAERLTAVLGGTAQFWLTREEHYRAALGAVARIATYVQKKMMIANDDEYNMTKDWIVRFQRALEGIDQTEVPSDVDPLIREAQKAAVEGQIADLQSQLQEYDAKRR